MTKQNEAARKYDKRVNSIELSDEEKLDLRKNACNPVLFHKVLSELKKKKD